MRAVREGEREDMGSNRSGEHPLEGLPERLPRWIVRREPALDGQTDDFERQELIYRAIRQLAQFAWYSHVHTKAALDDLAEVVRAAEGMRPRGQ